MTKSFSIRHLRTTSALPALALLGAGLALTAIPVTPAHAQDYTNVTASGRVVGTGGVGVAGATVTVTSNAQGFSRTATTDDSGSYRIPQLPQGSYTFAITAPNFQSFTDPNVDLSQSESANTFELAAEGATAGSSEDGGIIVTGRRVRVADFERTTTGAVIDIGDLAVRVPVARDITSVVTLSPGTAVGDTAFGNLPAINGASVAENAYFLNGLNITDFRRGLGGVTVPFEFYNTVEVKNGGFAAEFGRSTGGIVNATTKSGSNEFHGGAVIVYEPNALAETAPDTSVADNDADYRNRVEANFFLSGPIIKDRLFFYGLYVPRYVQTGLNPDNSNFYERRTTSSPFFGGKLDAIITDGHRLEFTYFDTTQNERRDTYRFDLDTEVASDYVSTLNRRTGGENYVARYTGAFTNWLTVSAAYGKNKNSETAVSSLPDLPRVQDNRSGTAAFLANPNTASNSTFDTREFYRGDVDIFVDLFGSHHFRGGYDREELDSDTNNVYNGDYFYQYFTAAAGNIYAPPGVQYLSRRFYENIGGVSSVNEAFYLQDSWSLLDNRLTLQLGVRNDRFENKNVGGETYFKSGNQWAPRLGFSFDPLGDGTTKLYGNYGRYYLPVAANTNIRLGGAELDYTGRFELLGVNPNGTPVVGAPLLYAGAVPCPDTGVRNCSINANGEVRSTASTVARNLKPQRADEYILGAEARIGPRMRVGVFGTYRKLIQSLEDAAIDQAVLAYCDREGVTGCEDIWTGFHQYVLLNPGLPSTITLSDPINGEADVRTVDFAAADLFYPKAKRTYKAVTFTFDREFDGVWSLSANYTYSKSRGNIEGGVQSDIGQADTGLTQDFDQPGFTIGAYGYLPGDARHNIKAYGSYQVTPWFNFGANVQVISPRRFGCLGLTPTDIDPFAADYGAAGRFCQVNSDGSINTDINVTAPTQVVPRGSAFKSDWQSFTNLTFSFDLPTEDVVKSYFRIDVFNVFNEKNGLDYDEFGTDDDGQPSSTYGSILGYQTPRYFRFQLGVNF